MKKILVSLVCLLLLVSCKEKKIKVNYTDTGFQSETFLTIEHGYYLENCLDGNENKICILRMTLEGEKVGYDSYDLATKEYKELGIDAIPTKEKYPHGSVYEKTDEFKVFVKNTLNDEGTSNLKSVYVEKDNTYTFLYEASSSVDQNNDYQHVDVYKKDNKVYLVFVDEKDLVINEITYNSYIEVDRKPLVIDEFKLVDYYFNQDLVLIYESSNNKKIFINNVEYIIEKDTDFLVFDKALLVSKYEEELTGQKIILKTYVIDRITKEIIDLDEEIDCSWWLAWGNNNYFNFNDTGYLTLLTYKENSINVITTSFNKYANDYLNATANDKYIFVITMDYTTNKTTYDLITLE